MSGTYSASGPGGSYSWNDATGFRQLVSRWKSADPEGLIRAVSNYANTEKSMIGFHDESIRDLESRRRAEYAKPVLNQNAILGIEADLQRQKDLRRERKDRLDAYENAIVLTRVEVDNRRREQARAEEEAAVPPPPSPPTAANTVGPSATVELDPDGSTSIPADAGDEAMAAASRNLNIVSDTTSSTGYRNELTGAEAAYEIDEVVVTASRRSEIAIAPTDHRVRIKPLNPQDFYGEGSTEENAEEATDGHLLDLIKETNGVIFPYTPSITYGHQVNYGAFSPVHANQDYQFYTNTMSVQFQVTAKFTAQNEREAQYLLAAKHFFQVASKMRFGEEDEKRGLPPPMLVLSGYGDFMFNNLPIIMNNFTVELPDDQDYVKVDLLDATSWVPTVMVFSLTFTVQQTPAKQRSFSFDRFASGDLLKDRGWM